MGRVVAVVLLLTANVAAEEELPVPAAVADVEAVVSAIPFKLYGVPDGSELSTTENAVVIARETQLLFRVTDDCPEVVDGRLEYLRYPAIGDVILSSQTDQSALAADLLSQMALPSKWVVQGSEYRLLESGTAALLVQLDVLVCEWERWTYLFLLKEPCVESVRSGSAIGIAATFGAAPSIIDGHVPVNSSALLGGFAGGGGSSDDVGFG